MFETYKLCPKCGGLATLNYYFGDYICPSCYWGDDTPHIQRMRELRGETVSKLKK